MTIALTISAKEYSQGLNISPKKIMINTKHKVNAHQKKSFSFLVNGLRREVLYGSYRERQKKIKNLKKLMKGFVSILGVGILLSPTAILAQENQITPTQAMEEIQGMTGVMIGWGLLIALFAVIVGVVVACALFAVSGIFRMLRKREITVEWNTDIIKGLVQVLITIPVVFSLFYLAQILFRKLPFLDGML